MDYVSIDCKRAIIDNLVEAKHVLDLAKERYEEARKKLIEISSFCCVCSADTKVGGKYLTATHKITVEPRFKPVVSDFDLLPVSVRPFVKVTESISLTAAGKNELDEHVSEVYGNIDYAHADAPDFFGTLGISPQVSIAVAVKEIDG